MGELPQVDGKRMGLVCHGRALDAGPLSKPGMRNVVVEIASFGKAGEARAYEDYVRGCLQNQLGR